MDASDNLLDLPLFPLHTVLFPGGGLSLKVFEARYLDLMSRCLRSGEPFGVVALRQGAEVGAEAPAQEMEAVGVLARIEEVDAEQSGILLVRCRGGQRFRTLDLPAQRSDGLWTAAVPLPIRASGATSTGPSRPSSRSIQGT